MDFFKEGTSGNRFLSYVIFSKLPGVLQKEIIHTVGSNYPSMGQIFMSYSNIIWMLILKKPHEASIPKPDPRGKSKHSGDGKAICAKCGNSNHTE